jgi:sodium-dependent dicarboxylate transporter 2/3/5
MWLFEAVPAWTTSVMVVVLLLFMTSNSSLVFFENAAPEALGAQTSYKSLLHCFADPIIMLFIGGFVLAIAASKTGLDLFLARVMLKPFGKNPKWVLLGFLMVTGVFSMFLSNTATAAMMLTFLGPVLKALPADGKGKTALALAIPIAANVGGMGTPIGTPPNAIALKYMEEIGISIGFGQWMLFMIPFTILLLFIAWFMLLKLFPFKAKEINLNIQGELKKDWRSVAVYVTFVCTVLLWVLDKKTGVNANVVAMLPVGVCAIIGVLTKRDLEEISWSVLWMVAGGFALGVGLQETGLAQTLINAIPFGSWPALVMVIGSGLICYAMANFISHTATASLLVPILAVVGASVAGNLAPLGGVSTLLVGVAIGSSLGMVLPISTPPNAIAASTGMIEQKEMVKTGLIMGVLGLVLGYVMLILLGSAGFFG